MNETHTHPTQPIQPAQPKKTGMLSSVSAPFAFLFGIVVTIAVFSFFGLIAMAVIFMNVDDTDDAAKKTNTNTTAVANTNTVAALQSSINPDSIRYTKGSGKLTFVEYTDLECPYCKTFQPTLTALKAAYDGKVAFTIKHFPLNIHPKAERENGAAECAGKQGKFFEFMEKIFAVTPSNNKLEDQVLFDTATELGLNMDDFRSCVENKEYLQVVGADATEAQAVGATGTPFSILIDEDGTILTRFKGVVSQATLASAFDSFLAQQ